MSQQSHDSAHVSYLRCPLHGGLRTDLNDPRELSCALARSRTLQIAA